MEDTQAANSGKKGEAKGRVLYRHALFLFFYYFFLWEEEKRTILEEIGKKRRKKRKKTTNSLPSLSEKSETHA